MCLPARPLRSTIQGNYSIIIFNRLITSICHDGGASRSCPLIRLKINVTVPGLQNDKFLFSDWNRKTFVARRDAERRVINGSRRVDERECQGKSETLYFSVGGGEKKASLC
jgi:hypothetical protein